MTTKVGENCTINFELNALRLFLFGLELLANTLLLFLTLVFAILLRRTKSLGRNAKVLLANHQFAAFNIAWTRYILVPNLMTINGTFIAPLLVTTIQWLHDVSINVNTFIQVAITFECLASTFWPLLHDRLAISLCFSVSIFVWPWLASLLLYVLEQLNIIETVLQFESLELFNVISLITFCVLYVTNRRKYKRIGAGNLAGKYKVIVNIKTVRTLNFIAALSVIRNFITMSLLLLIILHFKPLCDYYAYMISSHSYDLTVSIYNLLLLLPLVFTNVEFKRHFKQFFGFRKSSKSNPPDIKKGANLKEVPNQQQQRIVVLNVLGENLARRNSRDYFRQLAESWQQKKTPATAAGKFDMIRGFSAGRTVIKKVKTTAVKGQQKQQPLQEKSNSWNLRNATRPADIGRMDEKRGSWMVEVDIPSRLTSY